MPVTTNLQKLDFSNEYTGSAKQEVLDYIKNAKFSVNIHFWNINQEWFYSKNGRTDVDLNSNKIKSSYAYDNLSHSKKEQ